MQHRSTVYCQVIVMAMSRAFGMCKTRQQHQLDDICTRFVDPTAGLTGAWTIAVPKPYQQSSTDEMQGCKIGMRAPTCSSTMHHPVSTSAHRPSSNRSLAYELHVPWLWSQAHTTEPDPSSTRCFRPALLQRAGCCAPTSAAANAASLDVPENAVASDGLLRDARLPSALQCPPCCHMKI